MKPLTGLYCVYDPTTDHLVHTTVSTKPEEAIELWMGIEGSMNHLANMFRSIRGAQQHCFKSWEQFEAEGYKVVRVMLTAVRDSEACKHGTPYRYSCEECGQEMKP